MSLTTCSYCSAERDAAERRCGNCGAPLRQAIELVSSPVREDSGANSEPSPVSVWEQRFPAAYQMARMGLGLPAALAGIVAVAIAGLAVVYALGSGNPMPRPPASALQGAAPPGAASSGSAQNAFALLPGALASAATCWGDAPDGGDRCVISAGDPFLHENPAANGDLTFTVTLSTKDGLANIINQWRAGGGTVIEDGTEFAEIGPSATVMYASTTTGLHLDTSSFASRAAAQTFLTRSGLVTG